jgi:glycosyltransferase involved in cell wall biosynthesis
MFWATLHQGDVNHITGDIHFLTYLLRRRRTILTVHDCVVLERLSGLRYWFFWFFWYWLPANRSEMITVISESTKRELLRHLRSENYQIEVIPDCVSVEFQPCEKDFNESCPRILQIGTTKNKNIERIAEALEGSSCKLVIIGRLLGEQKAVLRSYSIDFDNYVGISREELVGQYQQADLVMFASLYEGFGLPILESNAVGRPVITSKLFSMPEVGGDAACYVDPYDVPSIRLAVERITEDSTYRGQLVENGYRNVERFRASIVAARYASLYRRIYKESAQGR